MNDCSAMYWKEYKDLFAQNNTQLLLRLFIVIGISVWLPLQLFSNWIQMPVLGVLVLLINPLLIVFSFVTDTFAGERERHTLESLLATRLSNWSIVVGKIAALVTLSWGMTLVTLLVSLVVANIQAGVSSWSFYPPDRLLTFLLLSLVFSVLITAVGIVVSLRATTVRQAQQMLSYGTVGLGVLLSVLATSGAHLSFFNQLATLSATQAFLVLSGVVIIIDIVLLTLILSLFRRSRLLWN
jgi:ABC-2 type transport system permease protein